MYFSQEKIFFRIKVTKDGLNNIKIYVHVKMLKLFMVVPLLYWSSHKIVHPFSMYRSTIIIKYLICNH
jgi:hypothetical protein